MDKALFEAVSQSLILMEAARLKAYGAKVDAEMVQIWASDLQAAGIDAETVKRASDWFRRHGDGDFPSLPVFIQRALQIRGRTHYQAAEYVLGPGGEIQVKLTLVPIGTKLPNSRPPTETGRQASDPLPVRVRALPGAMGEDETTAERDRQLRALRGANA